MATTAQTGTIGERLVARWLEEHGYSTNIDNKGSGAAGIEARGNTRSLLVQVKSAVQPGTPATLSSDEERETSSRAAGLGLEAWEARVQLDQQLRQVGDIQWRKLT
jgi:hypothetical protein